VQQPVLPQQGPGQQELCLAAFTDVLVALALPFTLEATVQHALEQQAMLQQLAFAFRLAQQLWLPGAPAANEPRLTRRAVPINRFFNIAISVFRI